MKIYGFFERNISRPLGEEVNFKNAARKRRDESLVHEKHFTSPGGTSENTLVHPEARWLKIFDSLGKDGL